MGSLAQEKFMPQGSRTTRFTGNTGNKM